MIRIVFAALAVVTMLPTPPAEAALAPLYESERSYQLVLERLTKAAREDAWHISGMETIQSIEQLDSQQQGTELYQVALSSGCTYEITVKHVRPTVPGLMGPQNKEVSHMTETCPTT